MGISYYVISLGGLEDDARRWFETDVGLEVPLGCDEGRDPTLSEVRAVLTSLTDYIVDCFRSDSSIDFLIDHKSEPEGAVIWITKPPPIGQDDLPVSLFFHRGSEQTVILIMRNLARICGPFLVALNGDNFKIIIEDTPLDSEWE